ncbi:MAG: chromosomal replication initiator protein DnaA [Candidatus Omnitrophota bacterium]|nr:chromosomal replication initiator protein DnaA [Candidatus Omnitrophota bacterium]
MSKNWDRVRSILARELSEQSFKTWFEPLTCLDITDDQISLGVPDSYYGKWLQSHYQDLLSSAVKEAVGATRAIEYKVLESLLPPAVKPARPQPKQIQQTQGFELNSNYIFDSFVVGPGNRFAHAAAMAVSEAPARHYNPLFIHGPVGLGKTHLMQAIAHAIRLNNPGFRIQYISSEKFMNQLITAIQTRTTSQFRAKFRTLDLLLIDDIHFLAEKEATQEEFFHTFNTLYDAHKQIVVSSDRPPREIPGLEERLVSRFGWGLVTDIQPPNFETRVAILKKKMEKETVAVPDEVCYFIASKFKSNVRELEGALIRVVAYCALTGVPLTMVVVNQLLRDSLKEEEKKISMEKVQRVVASYFDLRVSDLRAKSRSRSVAGPRQIAMYLIRSLTDHSLPEIGEYFGGRDHSTVLHACQKIRRAVESDAEKLKVVEEIKGLLKS